MRLRATPPDGLALRRRAEREREEREARRRARRRAYLRRWYVKWRRRQLNRPLPGRGGEIYRKRVYDDEGTAYDLVIEIRYAKLAALFWRAVRSPLGAVALAHGALVVRAERHGGQPAHVGGPYAKAGPRETFARQLFADERLADTENVERVMGGGRLRRVDGEEDGGV